MGHVETKSQISLLKKIAVNNGSQGKMRREKMINGVKKTVKTVKVTVIMKARGIHSRDSHSQYAEKS